LLARQTSHGVKFGEASVVTRSAEPILNGREHEVVAVLRPEEVQLAPRRESLGDSYMTDGKVEEIVFSGALERMRVRLAHSETAAQVVRAENGYENGHGNGAYLEVTRTQHEQRAFPLKTGQSVAIGIRRLHVLPTPLSSFTVCAPSIASAQELSRHPLLLELASRMKTRIVTRVEAGLNNSDEPCSCATSAFGGAAVIAPQADTVKRIEWLLGSGAREVLLLPPHAPPPHRVLIHWVDEAARRATLAVSASFLRHVSAEAVYVGILPDSAPDAQRPQGMRALLDARSEAQAVHGLEMRTELRFGEVAGELVRQLAETPEQMLILGLSDIRSLRDQFGVLFNNTLARPVLIVYHEAEPATRANPTMSATAAIQE
jgi:hypothetical protein